jgi:hypothetical protein
MHTTPAQKLQAPEARRTAEAGETTSDARSVKNLSRLAGAESAVHNPKAPDGLGGIEALHAFADGLFFAH